MMAIRSCFRLSIGSSWIPVSPCRSMTVRGMTFMDRQYEVGGVSPFGLDIGHLLELIGTPYTTLMGMDILGEYRVLFFLCKSVHRIFSGADRTFWEYSTNGYRHGDSRTEVECVGARRRMFLDTGVKLS
jgi:hypothetical protein